MGSSPRNGLVWPRAGGQPRPMGPLTERLGEAHLQVGHGHLIFHVSAGLLNGAEEVIEGPGIDAGLVVRAQHGVGLPAAWAQHGVGERGGSECHLAGQGVLANLGVSSGWDPQLAGGEDWGGWRPAWGWGHWGLRALRGGWISYILEPCPSWGQTGSLAQGEGACSSRGTASGPPHGVGSPHLWGHRRRQWHCSLR